MALQGGCGGLPEAPVDLKAKSGLAWAWQSSSGDGSEVELGWKIRAAGGDQFTLTQGAACRQTAGAREWLGEEHVMDPPR